MSLKAFSKKFISSVDRELEDISQKHPYPSRTAQDMRRSLNAYREILNQNRNKLKELHDKQFSGVAVCTLLSELIDRFIVHIASALDICENGKKGFSVVALGGYGRSELNPCSDIDLLFLLEEGTESIYKNKIGIILQFLWDINLHVGHSARTKKECLEAAGDDTDLATSLLEARYLTGDYSLWMELKDLYDDWLKSGKGMNLVLLKIEERENRLELYNRTVQIRVPNVKESPGGLRDFHFARWLIKISGKGNSLRDIYKNGFIHKHEIRDYEESFDFLLRVRNAMHFVTGKNSDLLEHLIIPGIAKNLEYAGEATKCTEEFMREYYMKAGRVYRLTNHIARRFIKGYLPTTASMKQEIKSEQPGIMIVDRQVGFSPEIKNKLAEHPSLLVKIFSIAGVKDLELSVNAVSLIEKTLGEIDSSLPENFEIRTAFKELINMKKGIGRAFRLMHENNVLTRLIPEFDKISWHYQYDFYHAYTTDEHSIRVVENLEKMANGSLSNLRELTDIMNDVTAKNALYLAGLLHDIGKGGGKEHSVRGERMSANALERIGFDRRTVDLVKFLIREHLIMSHTSQRRDIEDEDTLNDFLKRVHSTGRLRMLTLLTFADLLALSDEVFTDWKKALLLSLYNKAMIYLEKGYEKSTNKKINKVIDKIIRSCKKSFSKNVISEHLKMLPEQYVRVTSPGNICAQIKGIESLKKQSVWVSFRHTRDVSVLTVISRDYRRALSDICGAISSSDINIVGAQIFTREDGIIIDTFLVVDEKGNSLISSEIQRMFKKNVNEVIAGDITAEELIKTHLRRWKYRKKKVIFSQPRVGIHNDISSRYTIIDVFATDYTGLLYDLTSVLASFDVDIHTAKIGTDEDQVADAFYVDRSEGGKIEDEKILDDLKSALFKTLNKA